MVGCRSEDIRSCRRKSRIRQVRGNFNAGFDSRNDHSRFGRRTGTGCLWIWTQVAGDFRWQPTRSGRNTIDDVPAVQWYGWQHQRHDVGWLVGRCYGQWCFDGLVPIERWRCLG